MGSDWDWAFAPLFLLGWSGICFSIATLGGWRKLAAAYPAEGPFSGSTWRFRSAELRWTMSYNHCLTIGAGTEGLYLSVFLPFRVGHQPLRIPWSEIAAVTEVRRFGLFRLTELRFRRVPDVPLRFASRYVAQLRAAPGARWPEA